VDWIIPEWSDPHNVPSQDDILQDTGPLPSLQQHLEVLHHTLLESCQVGGNSAVSQRVSAVRQTGDWDGFVDVLVEVGQVGDQARQVRLGHQLGQAGGEGGVGFCEGGEQVNQLGLGQPLGQLQGGGGEVGYDTTSLLLRSLLTGKKLQL